MSQCPISSQEISSFVSLKIELFFYDAYLMHTHKYIHMYIEKENKINIFSIKNKFLFFCFGLIHSYIDKDIYSKEQSLLSLSFGTLLRIKVTRENIKWRISM
jgi:hypothetical protein